MRMPALLLASVLAALPRLTAAKKPQSPLRAQADAQTIALARLFLKTPASELPPNKVDDFLTIDSATLPLKLRRPCKTKQFELEAMRRAYNAAHGKKARQATPHDLGCGEIISGGMSTVNNFKTMGFSEIKKREKEWLTKKTKCSENEMMCRFSLVIIRRPLTKKTPEKTWYLLQASDPLLALVEAHRMGSAISGSNFFGESSTPSCH
ncbi:MAG: hypothetical protein ACYCPQ_01840 [Elusimicrobiota bacterium]